MKKLIFVNGTMGSGKSSVCRELIKLLPNAVMLDGDWCWYMDPFVVTDETKKMVVDNICCLLLNYLDATCFENIVFCWVMHEQEIIDSILSRLDLSDVSFSCFTLTQSPDVLESRLRKDVDAGLRDTGIIGRSLEKMSHYEKTKSIKINTDVMNVPEIAEYIAKILDRSLLYSNH